MWQGEKGEPSISAQGMKGEPGSPGLPGLMGPKVKGNTQIDQEILVNVYTALRPQNEVT